MSTKSKPVSARSRASVVATLLALGGCTSLAVAEGASTIASGKALSDHVISFASGKDCSVVRTEQGLTYCVEDEPLVNQERFFCYQTLADVVCYSSEDPRRSEDTRIGLTVHNAVR